MKKLIVLMFLIFMSVDITIAQDKKYREFTGYSGHQYICLYICLDDAKEGDEVGYYFHKDSPDKKHSLKLMKYEPFDDNGTMHVVLDEYSPKGNNTGNFSGNLKQGRGLYYGTFTNIKGRRYKYELYEKIY